MLARLLGLETEYAIRYTPRGVPSTSPGPGPDRDEDGTLASAAEGARPGNDVIYAAIAAAVRELVASQRGERGADTGREQLFLENGGAMYYEFLPHALAGGLLEASTPECRGPSQVVLYQRAQETLLLRALPLAEARLRRMGHDGALGLLKNGRDGEDHVYGPQENYEAEIARGPALFLYRLGLALLFPLAVADFVLLWGVTLAIVAILVTLFALSLVVAAAAPSLRPRLTLLRWVAEERFDLSRSLGHASLWLELVLCWPLLAPFSLLLRAFAFRRERRALTAFLISRSVLTGAGTVNAAGDFGLSEKGPAIRRLIRASARPDDLPIFDTGNLMKRMMLVFLRISPYFALFARRQRLQLGLSDANCAQLAEYLKVGTTLLVLDMTEAGALDDAPRLVDPIPALHTLARDPTLAAKVAVTIGGERRMMSALDLQRWYVARARVFLTEQPVRSLEAETIARLWGEALDALEADPGRLVGRIDWVTKRWLLETAGSTGSAAVRKKIDLRYHELGQGYFARLEQRGGAEVLVQPTEIEAAITCPPSATPARVRGRLVRELAGSKDRVTVSWDTVRIGGATRAKVIRLVDEPDGRGP